MTRVKLRLLRVEPVRQSGGFAAFVNLFEIYAQVEQEGETFAGCIEGFSGSMESVGSTEEEVIQGLFDAFSLTVDYHIERDSLVGFLDENRIKHAQLDAPVLIGTPEAFEKEFTYLAPSPAVAGGLVTCAG